MLQISDMIRAPQIVNSVSSGLVNGLSNKSASLDAILKGLGWFPKARNIIKFLYPVPVPSPTPNPQKTDGAKTVAKCRCFQCYEYVTYEEIAFSRIINNYNRTRNRVYSGFSGIEPGFERYNSLSCVCTKCLANCESSDRLKNAPRSYGDIISDLLVNQRWDILADDLKKANGDKVRDLEGQIRECAFNYNEKQMMYNYLVNENARLKANLEMEMEKHKILNEYKSKNRELHDNMRNYILNSTVELFKTQKRVIDEQLAKYSELNNSSKYTVPECKICMQEEIRITLECGHLLCNKCHHNILEEHKKKILEESEEEIITIEGYPCPFCKTLTTKPTKIFL